MRFLSGRSVEIYDLVFPGIIFTLGYFRVCQVFTGIAGGIGVYGISSLLLDVVT